MNIAIAGASGFIGRALADRLRGLGYTVRTVSLRSAPSNEAFEGCDAVVNLAGEPVAQRWTSAAKQRIYDSRIEGTRRLVSTIVRLAQPPSVLINASAIGYYGSRGEEILTEDSQPGTDFLANICTAWEREARQAENLVIRVVTPRIGIVLGKGGGALTRMALPFYLGVGGRIGSGEQWMSWIHLNDLLSMIVFAISQSEIRGPLNATAPNPVKNADFTSELARILHRPTLFPVPKFGLRVLFGEMAAAILASQRALPNAALQAGFKFEFPDLASALRQIFTS